MHDFIAVELAGGKILVSLSLGDRNDIVRVGVTSGMALNDGEWHHVEVYRNGTVGREYKILILNLNTNVFYFICKNLRTVEYICSERLASKKLVVKKRQPD